MEHIFYWTGFWFWTTVCILLTGVLILALYDWYNRELSVTLKNLRFAIFGKSRNNKKTYHEIWSRKPRSWYRYCTRGKGNKNFARLAMKRLLYEVRKESLRKLYKNPDAGKAQ